MDAKKEKKQNINIVVSWENNAFTVSKSSLLLGKIKLIKTAHQVLQNIACTLWYVDHLPENKQLSRNDIFVWVCLFSKKRNKKKNEHKRINE